MSEICENCHVRPKFIDGDRVHDYCGRTCAREATANRSAPPPPYYSTPQVSSPTTDGGDVELCDFCGVRPKFVEAGYKHDYCGKSCARGNKFLDMLSSLSLSSPPTSASPSVPPTPSTFLAPPKSLRSSASSMTLKSPAPSMNLNSSNTDTCKFDWCQRPAHVGPKGKGEYCSIAHKSLAERICLLCLQAEKQSFSHFCSRTCARVAENKAPAIIEVPAGHVTFKSVADQFQVSWRHVSTCPTVRRVYKIVFKQSFMAQYDAYRTTVENRGQFVAKGRTAGNENRRWHGTNRQCRLGDYGNTTFCNSKSCSLCSILRNSFKLNRFGQKTGWGRFGAGIYTSSTSSKSNDYSNNLTPSTLKAMLLNKVVVGRGYKMLQDSTSLTAPPSGFDSVLAEVGVSLNHDELIVYTDDAVRPSFLVLYEE